MLEKSCREFLELLASKEPVPGGGGACAYVGALGMALGCMVANLTVGKDKYKEVQEDINSHLTQGYELINKLDDLVRKDAQVFYPLSKAYGLPRNTPEEILVREKTLQEALVSASQVPMDIAKLCAEALELLEQLAVKGTRIAISDIGVGAVFCEAALRGARLNVLINTRLMKNEEMKMELEKTIDQLESVYVKKTKEILNIVENAMR